MRIRVGHLYPDFLNIYADRGNIAVLERRAGWRGHELEVAGVSRGDALEPGAHDLLYIGGGQDREQARDRDQAACPGHQRAEACVASRSKRGGVARQDDDEDHYVVRIAHSHRLPILGRLDTHNCCLRQAEWPAHDPP